MNRATGIWSPHWIVPQWNVPQNVRAFITTRQGGFSLPPWNGFNLGFGTGDDAIAVNANRALLRTALPQEPRWLKQVHGAVVVNAEQVAHEQLAQAPEADASTCMTAGVVSVVMIADCLPVLLADRAGRCVGAVHAGWRGLAAGVIQNTVRAMRTRLGDERAELVAYLGPAIGPERFEVGADVRDAMQASLPAAAAAFAPQDNGKYRADIYALARQALNVAGVTDVLGESVCTASDARRFFSYRRDKKKSGRQAALIWLEPV